MTEVGIMLDFVDSEPHRDYLAALVYTGMRAGEASALRVSDVDLAHGVINVRRSFSPAGGGKVREQTPKSHKERTVPLPSALRAVIVRRVQGRGRNELVFTGPNGGRLNTSNVRRAVDWDALRARLDRPDLRVHDLRHTLATLLFDAGAAANDVQAILGHSSMQGDREVHQGAGRCRAARKRCARQTDGNGEVTMARDYHEVRLGHYSPLFDYLMRYNDENPITLSFDEIEKILGRPLPSSARTYGIGWWTTNPTATQARSWLAASRHPRPTGDGRVEFVSANTISWSGAVNHLRITRMAVAYARDRLTDSASLDKWMREITDGWWEPHVVYVIRYAEANITKVGLTNVNSSRLRMLTQIGGELVDAIQVPNRWVARVLEGECLTLVDEYRVEPPLWIAQVAGATEFWRDGFALPPLQQVFETTCGSESGDSWKASIARSGAAVNDG